MSVISYWQGCLRLACDPGDAGVCGAAVALPQDVATAVVVIAAILVRHFARGQWPGWYRARVEGPGGVVTVTEDDERVRLARLLLDRYGRGDLTASALAAVRGRVLACTLGEQMGPAAASSD